MIKRGMAASRPTEIIILRVKNTCSISSKVLIQYKIATNTFLVDETLLLGNTTAA